MLALLAGPVGAVLLSAALVYAGNGLQGMILPLRGVAEGFPTPVLGLMGSAFSAGFMAGCLIGPRIVRRVGHIRSLAVFSAVASSGVLLYSLMVDPWVWLGLRVLSGLSLAGMFMVIESWLNEKADNSTRGRIFGAYMIVNYVAVTGGQMGVALGDPQGFALFAISAIGLGWALIPVGLTSATSPAPIRDSRIRVVRLFRISPVGAVGAVLVGITSGAFGSLGTVFVARIGFGTLEAALFMSAAIAGAAAMQVPAGWLSDRMDRRYVIVAMSGLASVAGIWMAVSGRSGFAETAAGLLGVELSTAWIFAAFFYGAVSYPLYGLVVAHLNDFVEPDGFVEASSGVMLLWSVGAMAGPLIAGFVMAELDPHALFLCTAAATGALAGFSLWRITRRSAPAAEDKGAYVPAAVGRTTPVAAELDPRATQEEPESTPVS